MWLQERHCKVKEQTKAQKMMICWKTKKRLNEFVIVGTAFS